MDNFVAKARKVTINMFTYKSLYKLSTTNQIWKSHHILEGSVTVPRDGSHAEMRFPGGIIGGHICSHLSM